MTIKSVGILGSGIMGSGIAEVAAKTGHEVVLRSRKQDTADAMVAALEEELPVGMDFTRPAGGMFVWLEMPEGVDAHALLQRCLKAFVAFVPGFAFYPEKGRRNTARLNFSNLPPEKIRQGVRAFARCLAEEMEARQPQAALSAGK